MSLQGERSLASTSQPLLRAVAQQHNSRIASHNRLDAHEQ